jgi:hypothetical protein
MPVVTERNRQVFGTWLGVFYKCRLRRGKLANCWSLVVLFLIDAGGDGRTPAFISKPLTRYNKLPVSSHRHRHLLKKARLGTNNLPISPVATGIYRRHPTKYQKLAYFSLSPPAFIAKPRLGTKTLPISPRRHRHI